MFAIHHNNLSPPKWHKQKRKAPLFILSKFKVSFQPGRALHIIIVTGPPTVPSRDLNPGPLSLQENALLTELMRRNKRNQPSSVS